MIVSQAMTSVVGFDIPLGRIAADQVVLYEILDTMINPYVTRSQPHCSKRLLISRK